MRIVISKIYLVRCETAVGVMVWFMRVTILKNERLKRNRREARALKKCCLMPRINPHWFCSAGTSSLKSSMHRNDVGFKCDDRRFVTAWAHWFKASKLQRSKENDILLSLHWKLILIVTLKGRMRWKCDEKFLHWTENARPAQLWAPASCESMYELIT
jgi:hypothetical protein